MSAYDDYRRTGGTLERDAFYAQALHQTASAINVVVRQPQTALRDGELRRLWSRFAVLANEYRSFGGTERAMLDLINRINQTVEAALRGIPQVTGEILGAVSKPLAEVLWPLAIVAGALLFLYLRKR